MTKRYNFYGTKLAPTEFDLLITLINEGVFPSLKLFSTIKEDEQRDVNKIALVNFEVAKVLMQLIDKTKIFSGLPTMDAHLLAYRKQIHHFEQNMSKIGTGSKDRIEDIDVMSLHQTFLKVFMSHAYVNMQNINEAKLRQLKALIVSLDQFIHDHVDESLHMFLGYPLWPLLDAGKQHFSKNKEDLELHELVVDKDPEGNRSGMIIPSPKPEYVEQYLSELESKLSPTRNESL